MGWHYKKWNREIGPVDDGELERLFSNGEIHKGTLVRPDGGAEWARYGQRHDLPPAPPQPSPPPPSGQDAAQGKPEDQYAALLIVLAIILITLVYYNKDLFNFYSSSPRASSSSSAFARAISGERWTINDDNIVVLAHPKVPGSQEEMMNDLVTALSPGARVEVLENGWGMIKVNVINGGRAYAQGWIVAHTVEDAVRR